MENENTTGLPIGTEFEKYIIEKELGRGGMGIVYLAKHKILDSHFAVKILLSDDKAQSSKVVSRFIREAKLAGKIKHRNLVAVHDVGLNSQYNLHYIVMDFVSGGSLKDRLKREGRLSEHATLDIIEQIASALEAANSYGMVHRDIKPDNIMFDSDGSAKLADLGIAKTENSTDTMLTVEASIFGTPAYMSPEQAMDSHKVDIRSDIYSLGMVAFEMLTGQRVYQGDSMMNVLSQVLLPAEVPNVREFNSAISEEVACLIASMVAKNADRRPATPTLLIERIKNVRSSVGAIEFQSATPVFVAPEKNEEIENTVFEPTLTEMPPVKENTAKITMSPDSDSVWTTQSDKKIFGSRKTIFTLLGVVISILLLCTIGFFFVSHSSQSPRQANETRIVATDSQIYDDDSSGSYFILIPVGLFAVLGVMVAVTYKKI